MVLALLIVLSHRSKIHPYGNGWTPLHVACAYNREEVAGLLIEVERKRIRDEKGATRGSIPCYNMKDRDGENTPVFLTGSSKIVERLLLFHDLNVTAGSGRPLLWECSQRGTISESVARDRKLREQITQRWEGSLPLEEGKRV